MKFARYTQSVSCFALACCLIGLLLSGCGKKAVVAGPKVAYVVRGSVKLATPESAALAANTQDIAGDLDIQLFADNREGYCLRAPESLVAAASRVSLGVNAVRLQGTPLTYEIRVVEENEQKYPISFYPVASIRIGRDTQTPCVADPAGDRFAGVGATTGATPSACCGLFPKLVTVTFPGEVIENVDLLVQARERPQDGCPEFTQDFNRCTLSDACRVALGDEAAVLVKDPGGAACSP